MNENESYVGIIGIIAITLVVLFTQCVRCNRDDNVSSMARTREYAAIKVACIQAGRTPLECEQIKTP